WGATFRRELHDLLPLLNEMAGQLGQAIHARIGQPPYAQAPNLSSEVVRAYLLARQAISRRTAEGLREAVRRFDAIAAQAPGFASAWASRAECELLLAHYGAADAGRLIGDCRDHIERALALERGLPLALSARSAVRLFFDCDVDGAAHDAERALAAMPQYVMAMLALANVAAVRGDFAAASAWIKQARLTDPLDVGIAMNLGDHMIFQDRYEDAVRALTAALQLVPDHRPSRLRLAWALALCGRAQQARAAMQAAASAGGADPAWLEHAALVAAAAGDIEAAAAHAQALEALARTEPVPAWSLARACAAAGRREPALRWLARAAEQRCSWIVFVHLMPVFDGLGGAAHFGALAQRALGRELRAWRP
ncbi:MAG: tetratricopeptide repeat protein, partial [Burkholderiaceae bacterium]|nr:tetratricopeptide repeat protein [Burkholderiaceae bacterium]